MCPSHSYNKYENLLKWTFTKIKIHEKHDRNNQAKILIPRMSIYTCQMGENIGHEKGANKPRPILVVSNDTINGESSNVIIIPLSTTIKWKDPVKKKLKFASHYVLKNSRYTKLTDDSAVQCEDIRCVSKARLGVFICMVDEPYDIKEINKRIKYTLQV